MKKRLTSIFLCAAIILVAAGCVSRDVSLREDEGEPTRESKVTDEETQAATVDEPVHVTEETELIDAKVMDDKLIIAEGETLIISDGSTLDLKKGCDVAGTLLIENGGYLAVSGGELEISGAVINDGTLSIGENAVLSVDEGMLYTSPNGAFKSETATVYSGAFSTIANLGTASVSGRDQNAEFTLCAGLISAVCAEYNIDGTEAASETLTAEQAMEKASAGYYLEEDFPMGGSTELLTMLFDNGSTVKITFSRDKIITVNDVNVREILMEI